MIDYSNDKTADTVVPPTVDAKTNPGLDKLERRLHEQDMRISELERTVSRLKNELRQAVNAFNASSRTWGRGRNG